MQVAALDFVVSQEKVFVAMIPDTHMGVIRSDILAPHPSNHFPPVYTNFSDLSKAFTNFTIHRVGHGSLHGVGAPRVSLLGSIAPGDM